MEKLNIVRVGGITSATSRFLDLLADERIEKLTIMDYENNIKHLGELLQVAKFFNIESLLNKMEIKPIKRNIITRGMIRAGSANQYVNSFLSQFDFLHLKKSLSKLEPKIFWFGDNDFDGSNILLHIFDNVFHHEPKYVRSYKETRYSRKWEEEYMLRNADSLIFPHNGYIDFFYELYGITPRNTYFADLDWRYSKLIDYVKFMDGGNDKLSKDDCRPHVCILTGRALSDVSENRSGYRYYYLPIIEELVKRGVVVHLHALRIVPDKHGIDSYRELSKRTELLRIEKPLKLVPGENGYSTLKRYDAGLLHPTVPNEKLDLYKFQCLNIPNRFYEYEIADVVPLIEKGSLPSLEKICKDKDFGIIYGSYDELGEKLNDLIKGNLNNKLRREDIADFSDFRNVLIDAINSIMS